MLKRALYWAATALVLTAGIPQCSPLALAGPEPQTIIYADYQRVRSDLQELRSQMQCAAAFTQAEAPTEVDQSLIGLAKLYLAKALPVAPYVLREAAEQSLHSKVSLSNIEYLGGGVFGRVFAANLDNKQLAIKVFLDHTRIEKLSASFVFQEVLGTLGVTPRTRGIFAAEQLTPLKKLLEASVEPVSNYAIVTDLLPDAMAPTEMAGLISKGHLQPISKDEAKSLIRRMSYINSVLSELGIVPIDEQALIAFDKNERAELWLVDVDGYRWSQDHGVRDSFLGGISFSAIKYDSLDFGVPITDLSYVRTPELTSKLSEKIERPWADRTLPADVQSDIDLLISVSSNR